MRQCAVPAIALRAVFTLKFVLANAQMLQSQQLSVAVLTCHDRVSILSFSEL